MNFSKYSLVQRDDVSNRINVYNLINKAAITIDCQFDILGKSNDYILSMLPEDTINILRDNELIFDNNIQDWDTYSDYKLNYQYTDEVVRFVIHLNYNCNLKCGYCYQNVIKDKIVMSDVVLGQTLTFIREVIYDIQPELVDICFIGGEPTLHSSKIITIIENIQELQSNCIFSIVTNGTFGNKKILDKLVSIGLSHYLITLDGPRSIHDSLRISQSGRGSYDIILKNLKMMQERYSSIDVNINVNLNSLNYLSIEELLIDLANHGIDFPVLYSFVIDTKEKKYDNTIHDTKLIWKNVHELSKRYGYRFRPFYRDTFLVCSMFQKNNFSIGADGYIYSCIEAVGVPEYRQIHVRHYGTPYFDYSQSNILEYNNLYRSCQDCTLLPVCDGGCLYRKNNNDFSCPKENMMQNDVVLAMDDLFGGN